ncbi:ECF subfamily RNA polymerase sigma-24 subunit [Nitritalea halalkaliphila LW7]|uniref:RNA polymerase sigma factor n=1 Tax=Nitritalea halalkaliphila LW7 TaxID=1189621 RepID=I5CAK8_9BACT|nr:sigma-70 family RNA polymerase sigma factor [Nitritalea halalkaliphila]EIM78860.1 ECF subfamily RNA polymerase sigma-24 subunit [Nitritalea halalkaliphila LW7]
MVILHEDADDVLQETFLKAWRNIGRFEGQSSLYTWLYRIAVNESLNFLEKKKRRLLFFSSNHEEEMARYVQHAPEFDGDEVERRLQRALLTLPDKQRLVFQLRYYDELSYEAISEITGTSVGSLKASYHHAAKKVEQSVKEE